jgi:hypothetical protein
VPFGLPDDENNLGEGGFQSCAVNGTAERSSLSGNRRLDQCQQMLSMDSPNMALA